MNKTLLTLSFLMGVVVLSSNYLVQFPFNYYGLDEILTYGAFSYPIAFLITDLANRSYGKIVARRIVYLGFLIGIGFTFIFSTDFADLISLRIEACTPLTNRDRTRMICFIYFNILDSACINIKTYFILMSTIN